VVAPLPQRRIDGEDGLRIALRLQQPCAKGQFVSAQRQDRIV
jgi:hypothetical protein